jgi:hydroxyacylglutathione hydrolase
MTGAQLPLEDTFGDILRKAMRGTATGTEQLAKASGTSAAEIEQWLKDQGAASDDEARALARVLHLDGRKLTDSAARRWYPPIIERPDIRRHSQESQVLSNGYVFFLKDGRRAALVDPAGNPGKLLRILREGGYDLEYILITHKHDDHCDAASDVARAYPSAQIVMHRLDVHAIGPLASQALPVRDGATLPFGKNGSTIRMFHTPGHTDGSTCYLFDGALFSGDTLFAASVGGAYGDASTYGDILDSIRSKLLSLPGETVVMPGHGPPTTIALEKEHNPFFPSSIA